MLECWNIGDQSGNKTILIVKNSFKPIIPSFHYSNWGEAPKFKTILAWLLVVY
jgi:hypothetical protein